MIPFRWWKLLQATPGKVLVVRDKVEDVSLILHNGTGYDAHTLSATATVVSIGEGCDLDPERVKVGTKVLLAPSAGRSVVCGYRKDQEVALWVIHPSAIRATLTNTRAQWAPKPDGDAVGYVRGRDNFEQQDRFDEGDTRGLR